MLVYAIIIGMIILSGFYLFPRFYSEVNRMVKTLPTVLQNLERDVIVPMETRLTDLLSEFFPPPVVEAFAPELTNLEAIEDKSNVDPSAAEAEQSASISPLRELRSCRSMAGRSSPMGLLNTSLITPTH